MFGLLKGGYGYNKDGISW